MPKRSGKIPFFRPDFFPVPGRIFLSAMRHYNNYIFYGFKGEQIPAGFVGVVLDTFHYAFRKVSGREPQVPLPLLFVSTDVYLLFLQCQLLIDRGPVYR